MSYCIGKVYSVKTSTQQRLYLIAVADNRLITCRNGIFMDKIIKTIPREEPNMSVSDLCAVWKIDLRQLDIGLSSYFSPDEEAISRAKKEFSLELEKLI